MGLNPSENHELVGWDDDYSQLNGKINICHFPVTDQIFTIINPTMSKDVQSTKQDEDSGEKCVMDKGDSPHAIVTISMAVVDVICLPTFLQIRDV